MTRVNFYLLEGSGERACELFACRLAEKAYRMTHRTFIHTPSAAAAGKVDDLLWTFRDGAFVPHTLADATANADELGLSAVLIGGNPGRAARSTRRMAGIDYDSPALERPLHIDHRRFPNLEEQFAPGPLGAVTPHRLVEIDSDLDLVFGGLVERDQANQ